MDTKIGTEMDIGTEKDTKMGTEICVDVLKVEQIHIHQFLFQLRTKWKSDIDIL